MSLNVPASVIEIAKSGRKIPPHVFIEVVQTSLPALWKACTDLVEMHAQIAEGTATLSLSELSDKEYGEVLRGMASTAIHRELNRFFYVRFEMMEARRLSVFPVGHQFEPRELHRMTMDVQNRYPRGSKILANLAHPIVRGDDFSLFDPRTMSEDDRIELLHLHAILPDRMALERAFDVEFAFKNCCASGGKGKGKISPQFETFCSIEAQILHQSPEMTNC